MGCTIKIKNRKYIQMGKTLRELRLSKGYTLQQFAEIIDVDLSTYSKYETGSIPLKNIHLGTFLKIALAYEITCEELLNIMGENEHEK